MPSRRQQILDVLRTRLSAITLAGGFQTDAGTQIFINELPILGPDDPSAAIVILSGNEVPLYQGEQVSLELPLEIQAHANEALDNPWLTVEAIISDIKTAVELDDRTLGGLVRQPIRRGPVQSFPREAGMTTVGATVTYLALVVEPWGAP